MRLVPYTSFAGVEFGAAEPAVVAVLGGPVKRQMNHRGATELHFQDLIVRMVSPGGVAEFAAAPPSLIIGDVAVGRHHLPSLLLQNDPDAHEDVGFVFSPRFGLMVDVEHDDHWVTALPRAQSGWLAERRRRPDPAEIEQRRRANKAAEAAWAGKERACPRCGTVFRSVANRGGCPKCGHVFHASHPEGGGPME